MALLFMDSMQHYDMSSTTGIQYKWPTPIATPPTIAYSEDHGRFLGQKGLSLSGTGTRGWYRTITAGSTTVYFGGWMNFIGNPSTVPQVFVGEGATEHVSLRGDGTGKLTLTRNGTVLGTSTNSITPGVWYWVEMKVTVHDSTGVAELRVDGSEIRD
jgi:hypothetical protein